MMMTIAEVLPVRDAHHKGVGNCSMIVIIMAWNHKQCHYMSCCVFVNAVWSRGSKSIYKIVSEKCVCFWKSQMWSKKVKGFSYNNNKVFFFLFSITAVANKLSLLLIRPRRNIAQWYVGSHHFNEYNHERAARRWSHRRHNNHHHGGQIADA